MVVHPINFGHLVKYDNKYIKVTIQVLYGTENIHNNCIKMK